MTTGLFVCGRAPDVRLALCLGDGPEPKSAWFLFADGEVRCLTWQSFHDRFQMVGVDEKLTSYRFTSPLRAAADWHAGVFADGFATATSAQWQLTLKPPSPS